MYTCDSATVYFLGGAEALSGDRRLSSVCLSDVAYDIKNDMIFVTCLSSSHMIFLYLCLLMFDNYGCPLSISGRPCYILPMFFYLFIFFTAALFSGPGERRFAKVLHVVDLECH